MRFWNDYEANTVKGIKKFHFDERNGVKYIVLEDGFSFKYDFLKPPDTRTTTKEIIIDSARSAVALYYETGICDWEN